jgi:hypothetical protein
MGWWLIELVTHADEMRSRRPHLYVAWWEGDSDAGEKILALSPTIKERLTRAPCRFMVDDGGNDMGYYDQVVSDLYQAELEG